MGRLGSSNSYVMQRRSRVLLALPVLILIGAVGGFLSHSFLLDSTKTGAHVLLPPSSSPPPPSSQRLQPQNLAVGDWVFRMGHSHESYVIATVGKSRFSHIGLVVKTTPHIEILHAITGENEGELHQVEVTAWEDFIAPEKARLYGVARPTFLTESEQQKVASLALKELGKPFVLTPQTHHPLYCTTLIDSAIRKVKPEFSLPWMTLELPLLRGEYLHPEAFASYEDIAWVISPHPL